MYLYYYKKYFFKLSELIHEISIQPSQDAQYNLSSLGSPW